MSAVATGTVGALRISDPAVCARTDASRAGAVAEVNVADAETASSSNASLIRTSSGRNCLPPPTMMGVTDRWYSSTNPALMAWAARSGPPTAMLRSDTAFIRRTASDERVHLLVRLTPVEVAVLVGYMAVERHHPRGDQRGHGELPLTSMAPGWEHVGFPPARRRAAGRFSGVSGMPPGCRRERPCRLTAVRHRRLAAKSSLGDTPRRPKAPAAVRTLVGWAVSPLRALHARCPRASSARAPG